jgi:hypothetical protein
MQRQILEFGLPRNKICFVLTMSYSLIIPLWGMWYKLHARTNTHTYTFSRVITDYEQCPFSLFIHWQHWFPSLHISSFKLVVHPQYSCFFVTIPPTEKFFTCHNYIRPHTVYLLNAYTLAALVYIFHHLRSCQTICTWLSCGYLLQ